MTNDPKYTPAFRTWLHQLQAELGSEVNTADAWELYDDGASVNDALKIYREDDA